MMDKKPDIDKKIKLGISSCLLGEKVRYDGGHKLDTYLRDTLGRWVEYMPVCPEAECGMGVPREPMILAGDTANPRLITRRTGEDKTETMLAWAKGKLHALDAQKLCGFIFKSKSPSSGMERVRVYNAKGSYTKNGVGLFANAFMHRFPSVPAEEEGRLHDPELRENFIERIFTLKRWREQLESHPTSGALVRFHTENKLLILAHSREHYTKLGRLVAAQNERPLAEVVDEYGQLLMKALKLKATARKNANVLMHIAGYFKKTLEPWEKRELLEVIELHRTGTLPLIVPITLINHYVRKFEQPYLSTQTYLNPHPLELQLRNHV